MKRPEQALQIQVANYLRVALRPPTFWTAIDHASGVKNGRLAGALRKARGVKPGLPDILIMHPAIGSPVVVGIELKAKKGTWGKEQHAVGRQFEGCKAWYELARSIDDVEAILRGAGIPLHAKLS